VERPAWIVGNLPHVALWIGEGTGYAAPVSASGGTNDAAASALCLGQDGTHLFGRSYVVGEFDPGCAVTTERSPEPENHSAGLKEADLVIGLMSARPAERLVEPAGTGKVPDAERDQADALFHARSIAATVPGSADALTPTAHAEMGAARRPCFDHATSTLNRRRMQPLCACGLQGSGLIFRRLVSGGLERRGQILGGGLDGLGYRHDEPSVAIQDLTCVDDGQADDTLGARREANHVSLGSFFALRRLWPT
jgi:hypothetical protein